MAISEEIEQINQILTAHRRTIRHYQWQRMMLGAATPPGIAHGINDAREKIRQCKIQLRELEGSVADAREDGPSFMDLSIVFQVAPLLLLVVISAGIWATWKSLVYDPSNAPMPDTGWNIAVAGIGVEQSPGVIQQGDEGKRISDLLYGLLQPQAANILGWRAQNVGFVIGDPAAREHAAAEIATQTNADLVVYGIVRRTTPGRAEFVPEFYINRNAASYGSETLGGDQFGKPVPISLNTDVQNTDLGLRLDTLRLFFEALQNHDEGDYQTAQHIYEQALGLADAKNDPRVAAVLHLFLGALQLDIQQRSTDEHSFEEANRQYRAAWTLWPEYARPYLGRAAILYEQALADPTRASAESKAALSQFANQSCFEIPDATLTSNAARLGAALRCYEQARNTSGQTPTMDILTKTAFGIGSAQFLVSNLQIEDRWLDAAHAFDTVAAEYTNAEQPAQQRLRQLMGHALVRRALTIICPPDCEKPTNKTQREYMQALQLYEQGITVLQEYAPKQTCRDAPGSCYPADRDSIARYCQALTSMAHQLNRDTEAARVCPRVWDTVLPQ
jgi:tetratricopeptide (TPR) repeat protein